MKYAAGPPPAWHTILSPAKKSRLLARTYRVISAGRVVMVISEYFPVAYREAPESPDIGRSALAGAAR